MDEHQTYCDCTDPMPMAATDRISEALTALCGRCLRSIDSWEIGS